ncbi:MAG TPA: hypothetical protein VM939_06360, partial [Gemmatimonadaceae bacterium]|nr:hypothetical protein [Gemmatimonadaceae bacterium]
PNDDIAYSYVDALMSRGMLRSLSTLVRPYGVREIRAALDSVADSRSGVVGGYLHALSDALKRYELRKPGETGDKLPFRAKATFDLYTTVQTSSLRELMIGDSGEDAKPAMAGYFVFGAGHVSGSVRALLDNRLNTDPEFPGRKDRKIAGRTEDGYVRGVWKYAEATFGRVARSWGPTSLSGLQLGDDAYTYDHLFARAGTERINVSTVIARLDNYALEPGLELSRYFSIHRLALRRGRFEGALSEAFVYSGVRRGLEFSLVNPFNVYGLSWRNERIDGNLNFGGELSYRSRFGTFAGHVLLDDIQIDECDTVCNEPSSYGVTLTAEGIPISGSQRIFASYTRVSNLAYHTPNVGERYAIYSVGLGRGFSDYDEMRIGADLALVPRTTLRAYVARRRQGEGDYRKVYPQNSAFERTPGFLSGTVWTVNRAGISGATMIGRDFQLVGDAGVNQNTNRGNRAGYDKTIFEGRVKAIWVPRWLITFD